MSEPNPRQTSAPTGSPLPTAWTAGQRPGLLGTGLMLYTVDVVPEDEAVFDAWYTHEHLPERVSTPGFLRGRRYLLQEGLRGQRHLTLYETVDAEVFASAEYLRRLDSPTALTRDVVGRFVDPHRAVMRVLHSHGATVGRELSVVHLEPEDAGALRDWLVEQTPAVLADPDLCGIHLAEVDLEVTGAKSGTSEGAGAGEAGARPECVLLVDGLTGTVAPARRLADEVPARVTGGPITYNHTALLDHTSFADDATNAGRTP